MALFLVSHGMTMGEFLNLGPDHNITFPNSVVDMFMGSLGEPPGGWPPRVQQIILKGAQPRVGRPGEHLAPADFSNPPRPSRTATLSYLMYPEVYEAFETARDSWGDVSVLPTPVFYYGMEKGEEIAVEIEEGKTLVIKFLTVGDPHPDGTRTVFYELNGQPREVVVQDKSLKPETKQRAKADPTKPGHVPAPIPGAVTSVIVAIGEPVSKGDRLLVMEAMKMQTTVYAPTGGRVRELLAAVGDTVETKDLLVVIE
jgi:pyruvate carboxylase